MLPEDTFSGLLLHLKKTYLKLDAFMNRNVVATNTATTEINLVTFVIERSV